MTDVTGETGTAIWGFVRQGRGPSPERVRQVVAADVARLGEEGLRAADAALTRAVLGVGVLQPLIDDPLVTDVLVNGSRGVWVDRGEGLALTEVRVGDDEAARRLAVRLAGLAGRRLDDASPCVDGLLGDGVRLHAVLPPLVDGGAHISLRVPRRVTPTLDGLRRRGMYPPEWADVLAALVASRTSFVVTGGTGVGKSTLLAALLGEVDPAHRIVIVEEVRELAVSHPHVVRLQARPMNVEQQGAVDLDVLVRQSLRMRPDRLVVGEVRGAEVRELLSALNTGHEGGCGTIHANGSADVVARFEALGALAGLPAYVTRAQLLSAVRVVVHLRRRGAVRFVDSVGVLVRGERDSVTVVRALSRVPGVVAGRRVGCRDGARRDEAGRDEAGRDEAGTGGAGREEPGRGTAGPGWPLLSEWLGIGGGG